MTTKQKRATTLSRLAALAAAAQPFTPHNSPAKDFFLGLLRASSDYADQAQKKDGDDHHVMSEIVRKRNRNAKQGG